MNQILSTSNNYNNYNENDTKRIIIIFCLALIVISVGIILLKVYEIYKNKQKINSFANPSIEISDIQNSQIAINAYCEDGIKYISYIWNEENVNRINLNGEINFERTLDVPYNKENTLKVEVISINNVKGETSKTFNMDVDLEKPNIDSLTVSSSKLSIESSDNTGIAYIEYQWEDDEAHKIYADEEETKVLSTQIDIQRGTRKLTITVVDIHGNKETISKLVTGVNEPEIFVIQYKNVINIKATHDMGIKQISALVNNKVYTFNESDLNYTKDTTLEAEFPLEEGENIVKIIAYSFEKLSEDEDDSLNNYSFKTYVGKCTYEP